MDSVSHRSKFYPEDLELIDRVYAVAARISKPVISIATRSMMWKKKTRFAV